MYVQRRILFYLSENLHDTINFFLEKDRSTSRISCLDNSEVIYFRVSNATIRKYDLMLNYVRKPLVDDLDFTIYPKLQCLSIHNAVLQKEILPDTVAIDIVDSKLSPEIMQYLSKLLHTSQQLEVLIWYNNICDADCSDRFWAALTAYVIRSGLTSLGIEYHGRNGQTHLLQAISYARLTALHIRFIDIIKCDVLVSVLQNQHLRHLDIRLETSLSLELLTDDFCCALAKAHNLRIVNIQLEISQDECHWQPLCQALARNGELESIGLKLYLKDYVDNIGKIWHGFVQVFSAAKLRAVNMEIYSVNNCLWQNISYVDNNKTYLSIQYLDVVLAPDLHLVEHLACAIMAMSALCVLQIRICFYRQNDTTVAEIIDMMNHYLLLAVIMHRQLVKVEFRVSRLHDDNTVTHANAWNCRGHVIASKIQRQLVSNRERYWLCHAKLTLQAAWMVSKNYQIEWLQSRIPENLCDMVRNMQHLSFQEIFQQMFDKNIYR